MILKIMKENDKFTEYLNANDIKLWDWDKSELEEFFEQYGIEIY